MWGKYLHVCMCQCNIRRWIFQSLLLHSLVLNLAFIASLKTFECQYRQLQTPALICCVSLWSEGWWLPPETAVTLWEFTRNSKVDKIHVTYILPSLHLLKALFETFTSFSMLVLMAANVLFVWINSGCKSCMNNNKSISNQLIHI